MTSPLPTATIEFCGDLVPVDRSPFTIGRDADLVIDDNRFLHRKFLAVTLEQGIWLLANVGHRLSAAVSDADGRLEAFLAPGATMPLVFAETVVRFTAGPTTYEFVVLIDRPLAATSDGPGFSELDEPGPTTAGRVALTPEQHLLVLALAEPALRGLGRSSTSLPSSADAARRLRWTTTKFNRKLDNVCQKLTTQGVRGLHGGPGRLASARRARLVEHALSARLVTAADLVHLDRLDGRSD